MAAGGAPQFASLYVGDLQADVTEAMLYEIFNSVGPVASIRVCRDSITRKSLGYAYVNYHQVADAEKALDTLNYSSIKGRACRIMWSQRDPSLRKSNKGNVFVRNLDKNIDNKALYDTFSLFGNILSCKVSTDKKGSSNGYGFVQYETEDAAKQAIERVNGMQIGDKTVEVTPFKKVSERDEPGKDFTNVYVKHMPSDWDEQKINEVFGKYGTITSTCVMKDAKDRLFAFVNFENTDSAHKAVEELNKKDVRSDEQKAKDKEEGKEEEGTDGHPSHLLYVARQQAKWERARELKSKTQTTSAPRAQGVNLYIKNLDENEDDESLKQLFAPFGTITSAVAQKDEAGKCKGFGFVCFASPDEATKAVTEMHLKVVKGKPLYVGLAEKKEARAERLKNRYNPAAGGCMGGCPMMGGGKAGKGMDMGKGGKGKDMGMGMGMKGGMPGMGAMGGMGMMGMMGGMPPQMAMGKGGMPGMAGPGMMNPQQMAMMGKGGPMGMAGKAGMGMPMMGGPQMMAGKGMMPGMPGMIGMPGMPGMPGMMPQMGMMGGKPGMGPMGAMAGKGMPQQQVPQQAQAQAPAQQPSSSLNAAALAAAPPAVQKQMIGEKLYPMIAKAQPELAGKITGMMLEMDNSELLILLESEAQLKAKVDEAMRVLGGRS